MRLRSIELAVKEIETADTFLTTVWGMARAGTEGARAYYRGSGRDPYLVAIEKGESPQVCSVTFVCSNSELHDVETLVLAAGLVATSVVSSDPGKGAGIEVVLPEGERFRFLADAIEAPILQNPNLPVRLSHIVINSKDAEASAQAAEQALGFAISDRTKGMVFVRCNASHHSIAFARAGFSSLNHIAFEMADLDAVMRGVGRLRDHGQVPAWGPGRHGPGANVFAYFVSPFGAVVEFSTAVEKVGDDYLVGSPEDWTWPIGRIDHWGLSDKDSLSLHEAEKTFLFSPNDAGPLQQQTN